jgi:arylsulfatase A-like enzyme
LRARAGSRRALLACALSALACERAPEPAPAAQDPRPNLLIVMLDTTRADHLGLYGYAHPTSPALDALAAESRVFERALASSSWTLPSHASLFTGLHPSEHGATSSEGWLDDELETLAERLGASGYATYLFSANPFVSAEHNLAQGFEVQEHPWREPWRERVVEARRGRGSEGSGEFGRQAAFKDAGALIAEGFLAWLEARAPGRPFFAFLNLMEAHRPWQLTRAERERFVAPELVERSLRMDQSFEARYAWSLGFGGYAPEDLEAMVGLYDASLRRLDEIAGGLVAALRARGLLEQTLVAVVGDHGDGLGEHGLLGHEYSLYDELLRVPLLIRFPPLFAAGRVAEPVQLLDLFPTLLEVAGLAAPAGQGGGASLLKLDGAAARARPLVAEYLDPKQKPLEAVAKRHPELDRERWLRPLRSIERDGYKLIWRVGGEVELYAVREDPAERRDLAAQEPTRVAELLAELERWDAAHRPRGESAARARISAEQRALLEGLGYLAPSGAPGEPEGAP